MKIEFIRKDLHAPALTVDGEDIELMTPQRRQWVLEKAMKSIDHRYLEAILMALADKYGDAEVTDDSLIYSLEL
jgi:hypothetical protein